MAMVVSTRMSATPRCPPPGSVCFSWASEIQRRVELDGGLRAPGPLLPALVLDGDGDLHARRNQDGVGALDRVRVPLRAPLAGLRLPRFDAELEHVLAKDGSLSTALPILVQDRLDPPEDGV